MTRLNDHGIAHLILILVVIVGTAIGGSYYIMASKANSFSANTTCNRPLASNEVKAATATVASSPASSAVAAAPANSAEDAACQDQALDTAIASQKSAAAKTVNAEVAPTAPVSAKANVSSAPVASNGLSCSISGVPSRFTAGTTVTATATVRNTGSTTVGYAPLDFAVTKTSAGPTYALASSSYKPVNNLAPGSQQSFSFAIPTERFMLAKENFNASRELLMQDTGATATLQVNKPSDQQHCSAKIAFTAVVPKDNDKITLQPGDFVRDNYSQFAAYTVKDRGASSIVVKTVGKGYLTDDSRLVYATTNPSGTTKDRAFLQINADKRVRLCVTARSDDSKAAVTIRSGKFRSVVKPSSSYKDYCFTDKANNMLTKGYNDPVTLVSSSQSPAKNYTIVSYVRSVSFEIVK